jgi:hypothetical protein
MRRKPQNNNATGKGVEILIMSDDIRRAIVFNTHALKVILGRYILENFENPEEESLGNIDLNVIMDNGNLKTITFEYMYNEDLIYDQEDNVKEEE